MLNESGTKPFIVDPMHCLELNLMKTLWKYSFGDRMTDGDRELVAEYLTEIGLHLDIRAKGKRDPGQKWLSSAQVVLAQPGKELSSITESILTSLC